MFKPPPPNRASSALLLSSQLELSAMEGGGAVAELLAQTASRNNGNLSHTSLVARICNNHH